MRAINAFTGNTGGAAQHQALPPNGSNTSGSSSINNTRTAQVLHAADPASGSPMTASPAGLPATSMSGLGVQDQVLCGEYDFAAP
jgi:hypothetical protein